MQNSKCKVQNAQDKQRERLVELINDRICTTTYEVERIADHLLANGVIVLPLALGEKVYCLRQPCGGCECYNAPMTEEFIERCRKCDKWEIGVCDFDYELIPEWGKLVFPTMEQAVSARDARVKLAEERKAIPSGKTHGEADALSLAAENPIALTAPEKALGKMKTK